jgi:putative LysE/RhtB family amino acid efflux pump
MSLLVVGLGLGVVLAAQVGPVTLLIVRSVLRGGRAVAVGLAMAAAVALIDVTYALLGLAGAGTLLDAAGARLALGLASAAILIGLGARTLWRGLRARIGAEADEEVATPRSAFATAIAATALNPLTLALWMVSFPAAAPASFDASASHVADLLCGVALGTLSWYCGFAALVALARRRMGPRLLSAVDVAVGSGLVLFGGLVGYRTLRHQPEL